MLNRPFSTINTNIFDERTQNTTPSNIWGQNVLVSQEQHRKIFNTLTTSITGMSGIYPTMQPSFHDPNAVTFTFNRNLQYSPQQDLCFCRNLDRLQQRNAVDLLQLQTQMNQSYQCKFHLDGTTSTTDLGCKPTKVEGRIYDQVTKEEERTRKVNFNIEESKKSVEVQVQLGCQCCVQEELPKRRKKRKSRKKSPSVSTTPSDFSSDDDICYTKKFIELGYYEEKFFNQIFAMNQMFSSIVLARKQLEMIHNRFLGFKMAQDSLDDTLSAVQNSQNKWEQILCRFENQCDCNEKILLDPTRIAIYKLSDKLFTSLMNNYEMLESVESKIIEYDITQRQEPHYLFFQIMDLNLQMLEKLYIHINKLKSRVDCNDQIWNEMYRTRVITAKNLL